MRYLHNRRRSGVSEVVGALLIILILISALASLAFFLSTAQKQAQVRNNYLSGVQGEDLDIVAAQFAQGLHTPSGHWGSVVLTIENLDTQGSNLAAIGVNGSWVQSWEELIQGGLPVPLGPGNNAGSLTVASKSSVKVEVNFSTGFSFQIPNYPSNTLPFAIVVGTSIGNFFSTLYTPPIAVGTASTQSVSFGQTTRDNVILDGSKSQAVGGSIQSYSWRIEVPTVSSGCALTSPDVITVDGETVQYPSEMFSLGPGVTSFSLMNDCINGPIEAILTVTDQNGFNSTSQPLLIPADPNIDPAGSISAATTTPPCTSPCTVTVTVTDCFGNPMPGQVVNAVPEYGSLTSNFLSQTTNSAGEVVFSVTYTSPGSMDFETSALLPAQISFP
jgi:Bacterial Ig-like domain (group 1)